MNKLETHLQILGMRVREKVTGLIGVVTTVTFDLYGCVQTLVHPGLDKDDKAKEQIWFDINRLEIIKTETFPDGERVMELPSYLSAENGVVATLTSTDHGKGAADLPASSKY